MLLNKVQIGEVQPLQTSDIIFFNAFVYDSCMILLTISGSQEPVYIPDGVSNLCPLLEREELFIEMSDLVRSEGRCHVDDPQQKALDFVLVAESDGNGHPLPCN
ncbi:hypothetical protein AVEN_140667-1 [Araneus ventricosus]|uniref:Uncharacterized protein n=1 Tax=Araneus ventricosus TaxID=182803 RepID=A0A4Y2C4W6_ARAVE|nr:hypothetical protein AVEN_140667-1 [Araneus ventricosus]